MSDAVERQIEAAIERGEFDDLPGIGQPLSGLDRPYDPNWWVKSWIARDREAGRHAEDLVDIERLARRLWAASTPAHLEAVIDEIDMTRAEAGLDPLDREETREMWRSVKRRQA